MESDIQKLSIDDFDTDCKVFIARERSDGLRSRLLKYSQNPEFSAKLFSILQDNVLKFIKSLNEIHDDHATILINILQLNTQDEDTERYVSIVCNEIKNHLKSSVNVDIEFYGLVYLSLVSEFKIVFPHHIQIFLNYLSPKTSPECHAVILFLVVKSLELKQLETYESISQFFDYLIEMEFDHNSFLVLVTNLELLFPLCPTVCTKTYTSESCKSIISNQVKSINPSTLLQPTIKTMTQSLLNLVSSSCIDDECRKFNATAYLDLLNAGCALNVEVYTKFKILSVLCTVKLWNFLKLDGKQFNYTVDDLNDIIIRYLTNKLHYPEDATEYAVEALAYLTLNPQIRIKIRADESFVNLLIKLIKSKTEISKSNVDKSHSSVVYGLLLILSNLMQIKEDKGQSQELKTVNYLRLVATPKATSDSTKEDKDAIYNFNKSMLMNHKIITLVSKLKIIKANQGTGNNNSEQLIHIIYYISLNQQKSVRQELVTQGGFDIVISYLSGIQVNDSPEHVIMTSLEAMRATSKILILVDPALVFKKISAMVCIPILVELLGSVLSPIGSKSRSLATTLFEENISKLDNYEALLSLTNVCSLPDGDNKIKNSVISRSFSKLDDFIIDSESPLIQRSSWELISNLITSPQMLVKFFNVEDNQAMKRLDILFKMLELTDVKLQIVVAGLLANATSEFDMIPQLLVETEKLGDQLLQVLIRLFKNQAREADLMLRLSYVVLDLVYAAGNTDETLLNKFRANQNLKMALSNVIQMNKSNGQILEVVLEVLKFVKFD